MDKIAVLDFGGQYAHLIANRVRRLGVYTDIFQPDSDAALIEPYKAIIFSGGPSSVYAEDRPKFNPKIIDLGKPTLGICYGHQLINSTLGGTVQPSDVKEYGIANLNVDEANHPLLKDLPASSPMWMSHGDKVSELGKGFRNIASTEDCPTAAVANDEAKIYGIQFHPEVTHSEYGLKLMENFIEISGCEKSWNTESYLETLLTDTKNKVADKKVFLLVSGGVDSTVAFILLNKALGKDNVLGLHIDNGLMRKNESALVDEFLKEEGMDNLIVCDASQEFLDALGKEWEPEAKRKIIGDTFLEIKDKELARLSLNPSEWILAQGTIYPDTIESGSTENSDTIKTHHNRVQKVMDLLEQGLIIEPLAELYKDEVRSLGETLGIPKALLWRHPFPGPGLGVRYLCSNGQAQDTATGDDLEAYLTEQNIKGTILPIKSVGVQGDGRSYASPFVIQSDIDWKACEEHSTKITNRFSAINRVVYEAGSVDSSGYTLIEQYADKSRLDFLREIDNACTEFMIEKNIYDAIWQMPVVLLPLQCSGKPVAVVRPVCSTEAMTANFYEMDSSLLTELWDRLKGLGLGALLYDVTHKPPGTIEWE